MTTPYNYRDLLNRFSVTDMAGLAGAYQCRTCRAGRTIPRRPRRNAHRPAGQPTVARPARVSQPVLEAMDTSQIEVAQLGLAGRGQEIDIKKYSNLYVGFEFEGNRRGNAQLNDIARKYGLPAGKTNGRGQINTQVRLANGGSITVPIDDDLYKHSKTVTQVYADGSVDFEVVTRPLPVTKLEKAKEVFDYLSDDNGPMIMKTPRAGLHMTFLLDYHKELSTFDEAVVKNIMQMVRYYYKPLVYLFRQSERGGLYRRIPQMNNVTTLQTEHYTAVSLRTENELNHPRSQRRIWALEIRIPDGTDNWDVVEAQARFYAALIRHCAKITRLGQIIIPQAHWDTQQTFAEQINSTTNSELNNEDTKRLGLELVKRLKRDIDYFTINDDISELQALYTEVAR